MIPAESEEIVLSSKCENSDTSLNKEHLLFSFIPSKSVDVLCLPSWFYKCVRLVTDYQVAPLKTMLIMEALLLRYV